MSRSPGAFGIDDCVRPVASDLGSVKQHTGVIWYDPSKEWMALGTKRITPLKFNMGSMSSWRLGSDHFPFFSWVMAVASRNVHLPGCVRMAWAWGIFWHFCWGGSTFVKVVHLSLGGGFKYFLFSPLLGEDFQFD